MPISVLRGHTGAVTAIAFSPRPSSVYQLLSYVNTLSVVYLALLIIFLGSKKKNIFMIGGFIFINFGAVWNVYFV